MYNLLFSNNNKKEAFFEVDIYFSYFSYLIEEIQNFP